MSRPVVEFWFEFASTYSYLSVMRIERAAQAAGVEVLARAQADANKLALRSQTERAAELGLFGAPSFRVGEELFWGNDRLDDALAWAEQHAGEAGVRAA